MKIFRILAFFGLVWIGSSWGAGSELEPAVRQDPDFIAAKKAIDSKDWSTAIRKLKSAEERVPSKPDIENYLGYAYRQKGDLKAAFTYYEKALALDPRHRGAHEYAGEA